ncbi:MAG: N-acetylmannosamine-6-phosphate 2-epimerase, partial [Candidatus Marinimicrobia bacterium]|nr:N-acetylmannosamine-6-phosphate 2-epimerase [Candidatus Neomarinimicrobiota bacterium]
IRSCYPKNIIAIRKAVSIPVIGIYKKKYLDSEVFIGATLADNLEIVETGCEIVAFDATQRERPNGEKLENIVRVLKEKGNALLMADISNFNEGERACELGFDLISTTLSGYTSYTKTVSEYKPDFALLQKLVDKIGDKIPIVAEGRVWNPEDARRMIELGAYAVVVGSAITRPTLVTRRFLQEIQKKN